MSFWQNKGTLPGHLSDLNDSLRGVTVPRDPQNTDEEYGYAVQGPLAFELCATFSLPTRGDSNKKTTPIPVSPYYGGQVNWDHGAGRVCFARTIDPERYKLVK